MKHMLLAIGFLAGCSKASHCPEGLESHGDPPPDGQRVMCLRTNESGELVRHGPLTEWYVSGQKSLETHFDNGQQHGKRTEWYVNGNKRLEAEYKAGELHGTSTEWYDDGAKRLEATYREGKLDGALREWFPSGKKRREGTYRQGLPVEGSVTEWYDNGLKVGQVEWIDVPGGVYQMGKKGQQRRVKIAPFQIGKTEVTVAQYRRCVEAGGCTPPKTGSFCTWGRMGLGAYPINCVDGDQAVAFATWAGGRLPTEAEWEYAARSGGKKQRYPWGNDAPTCKRVGADEIKGERCGEKGPRAVCSTPDGNTAQGVCDMAGNVSEWLADQARAKLRSMRGGSFDGDARHFEVTRHHAARASNRAGILGLRVARSKP